ncbi:MAG TPA: YHYH protein [Gammaproteobacteria bacterium]
MLAGKRGLILGVPLISLLALAACGGGGSSTSTSSSSSSSGSGSSGSSGSGSGSGSSGGGSSGGGSGGGSSGGSTASVPGAPTLTGLTAGNGSLTLTFTAPSSDGGAAITSYTATCTADGNTTFTLSGTASPIAVTGMNGGVTRSCTVTATNSVGTGAASTAMSATPLSLDPEDLTHLTVGDNYVTTTTPAVGWIYECSATTGGGASGKGPWFNSDGTTWDETKKLAVEGNVSWSSTGFNATDNGSNLAITGDDLPTHNTGTFPIAKTDPAYTYDTNPNSIQSQTINWSLPDNPSVQSAPHCIEGTIGIFVTGVKLFAGLDKDNRDAGAWEIQDSCDGHPNGSNAYHYHTGIPQSCLPASAQDVANQHSPVIGYAADGFPIYGNLGEDGVPLSDADLDECHGHTHAITFNGKTVVMYHYHVTNAFPYTLGCYRGKPVHIQ